MIGRGHVRGLHRQTQSRKMGKRVRWGLKSWGNRKDSDAWSRSVGEGDAKGKGSEMCEAARSLLLPQPRARSVGSLPGPRPQGPQAALKGGGGEGSGMRGSGAACVFLLLLFLIKEEFISYLPPARGRGAAIGVNGAEEYKKISLRRIIKVTSWNINRRVTCKKCNITIFTRTAERGKAIKFNIKIFHSLDNLVNKHGIGTTFLLGMRDTSRRLRDTSS